MIDISITKYCPSFKKTHTVVLQEGKENNEDVECEWNCHRAGQF